MGPVVDRKSVTRDTHDLVVECQQYSFNGQWHDKNMRWEQIERKFKVALLGAVAPSLYNPALLQLHRPSNLEVEAAVAFMFGKFPASNVEVSLKQQYADMLIAHIRNQGVSPVAGKTRVEVFMAGIDILKDMELERILLACNPMTMAALPAHVSHAGMMACLSEQASAVTGHPVQTGSTIQSAAAVAGDGPVVIRRPGKRSLLVMGYKIRELRRKHSGGAGDWTVEAGYVCSPEAGLFISVDDCLAESGTAWPVRPNPANEVLTELAILNQSKH